MELVMAVVADAANKGEGDKLNVMGIFHRVYAAKFPVPAPHIALALELKASPHERGKSFDIKITLLDPDGKHLVQAVVQIEIIAQQEELTPIIPLALNFYNVVFSRPGNYRFDISVNGSYKGDVPLEMVKVATTPLNMTNINLPTA